MVELWPKGLSGPRVSENFEDFPKKKRAISLALEPEHNWKIPVFQLRKLDFNGVYTNRVRCVTLNDLKDVVIDICREKFSSSSVLI